MSGQDHTQISFGSAPKKSGGGGTPRQSSSQVMSSGKTAAALDNDTETLSHAKVPTDLKLALQKGRAAKGLTQKQLAQQLQMDSKLINEYESGKAIPNNGVIAKMERALGVKLPRVPKQ